MKQNLLIIAVLVFTTCFLSKLSAQTDGTLTFTFTEVAKTPTFNGNSQHLLAAWIQTSAGAFVKTKLRYVGAVTSDHLPTWAANASCTAGSATSPGCNTVDGITGATRSSWTTYTLSWDGKIGAAGTGTLQPDGLYKVSIQSTWNHGTGGTSITSYTFTKGASIDYQTPVSGTTYTNVVLHWDPVVTGINESNSENPEFIVYPNPTNGIFNVDYNKANNIKVTTILGVVVYAEKLELLSSGTKSIDLINFANGIYFINVSNGQGSSRHKVILNK